MPGRMFSSRAFFYFALKNMVLRREAGSSMGRAYRAFRESEIEALPWSFMSKITNSKPVQRTAQVLAPRVVICLPC